MSSPMELSIEQQFSLRFFQTQVEKMNHEQARELLIKLYEQMLLRENMYKDLIKYQWNLD